MFNIYLPHTCHFSDKAFHRGHCRRTITRAREAIFNTIRYAFDRVTELGRLTFNCWSRGQCLGLVTTIRPASSRVAGRSLILLANWQSVDAGIERSIRMAYSVSLE
jgi:hypothetical protein